MTESVAGRAVVRSFARGASESVRGMVPWHRLSTRVCGFAMKVRAELVLDPR